MAMLENRTTPSGELDSGYAWWRLVLTLVLGTVACFGNWSVVVLLPTLEIEFGTVRGGASLPYTGTMLGFAVGGVVMGRLADRVGIILLVMIGAFLLCVGYVMAALTTNIWQFAALSAVIGLGSAAGFAPLISDLSHWFRKHRALAVAFAASGSYLSGAVWPLIIEHFQATHGWRSTLIGIGLFVPLVMVPTGLLLRRRLQSTTLCPGRGRDGGRPMPRIVISNLAALLLRAAASNCRSKLATCLRMSRHASISGNITLARLSFPASSSRTCPSNT